MVWNKFDKIFVFIDPEKNYSEICDILKQKFRFDNFSNVEFHYIPDNKLIKDIYHIMIQRKVIFDYWNHHIDGSFKGPMDFIQTIYMIDIVKRCYLLKYDKIMFFMPSALLFRHKKDFNNYIENIPLDFNGYLFLNYKNKCDCKKEYINKYYFNCDWTNSIENINLFAMSRDGMKNILDSQTMILKSFNYYLVHRNMTFDSYIQHIASDI